MDLEWERISVQGKKHSARWGHSSCAIPEKNSLVVFGGYASSIYFQDVWVYNIGCKIWKEVKILSNGCKPSHRSNSSFVYSTKRECIIMFGGGSSDNVRFNDLWELSIEYRTEKREYFGEWRVVSFESMHPRPCERTYHSTNLYRENSLIIQGGQGYGGQLNDTWVCDLNSYQWTQIKTTNQIIGRKFHSSAILEDNLWVVGGVRQNYQTLNELWSLDLKPLLSTQNTGFTQHLNMEWVDQILHIPKSISLGRWGHTAFSYDNCLYVFGGRTYIEHNDLLMYDPQRKHVKRLNINKAPEGRRKCCSWLMGSYFIIDSGFNGRYLNDQFAINLYFSKEINDLSAVEKQVSIRYSKEESDIHINTCDNLYIDMSTRMIRNSFPSTQTMIEFLEEMAEMSHKTASCYASVLNDGVFVPGEEAQPKGQISSMNLKQEQVSESVLKKYQITCSSNTLLANKKKVLFHVIEENLLSNLNPFKPIRVASLQIRNIQSNLRNDVTNDAIVVSYDSSGVKEEIPCSRLTLKCRSKYFENCLKYSSSLQKDSIPKIQINVQQNLNTSILLSYCSLGHVIIPRSFKLKQMFVLYLDAMSYCFETVMCICIEEIKDLISGKNIFQKLKFFITDPQKSKTHIEQIETSLHEIEQIVLYSISKTRSYEWSVILEGICLQLFKSLHQVELHLLKEFTLTPENPEIKTIISMLFNTKTSETKLTSSSIKRLHSICSDVKDLLLFNTLQHQKSKKHPQSVKRTVLRERSTNISYGINDSKKLHKAQQEMERQQKTEETSQTSINQNQSILQADDSVSIYNY